MLKYRISKITNDVSATSINLIQMIIWILLTQLLLPSNVTSESQYECGAHGRFEYCIDGIPGCVIGCHCHPGYYFDTDTKICEPNIKLTQDFRRHYMSEPTRVHNVPFMPPTIPENEPSFTTSDPIDDKVDEITKDADDIGDWLYNQFFKTIENQVINKTKGDELLTRKSGTSPRMKKPKRRSRKYRKHTNKRKHKKGLKSKLLRITNDDSLFESGSSSSSYEDSRSSSSSESDSFENYSDGTKNDKAHGHRKIVIFNKKPKPPLPSFIFLPNIETPFYPPIGLPPPPAVPMYPMVPVPPMGPMFPYEGMTPKCEDNHTTTVTASTTTENPPSPSTTDTGVANLRNRNGNKIKNKFKLKKPKLQTGEESENEQDTMLWNNFNEQPRNKFFQKLQQTVKMLNSNKSFLDKYQEAESPLLDMDIPSESFPNSNILLSNMEDEGSPKKGNVNFKYLTQLIHRVDGNKTNLTPLSFDTNKKVKNKITERRMNHFYDPNVVYNQPPLERMAEVKTKRNELNDTFYSNLGRQIASMIRNIDSKGERQVNIEIEQEADARTSSNPVFNENSYAPRSYWERSVRSLLRYYNPFMDEFDYLKKSNENLFSLENKVEIAATTAHPLSLKELENIINTLGKAQTQFQRKNIKTNNLKSSKINRFSLLPESVQSRNDNKNFIKIDNKRYDTISYASTKKTDNLIPKNNRRRVSDNLMANSFGSLTPLTNRRINETQHKNMFYNMKPSRRPNTVNLFSKESLFKHSYMPPPLNPRNVKKYTKDTTQKSVPKYLLNPMTYNDKGLDYYFNRKNHYFVERASYPMYSNIFNHPQQFGQPAKPSYFHHEVQHFDYFNE